MKGWKKEECAEDTRAACSMEIQRGLKLSQALPSETYKYSAEHSSFVFGVVRSTGPSLSHFIFGLSFADPIPWRYTWSS
jgi:hypothetical protein